MKKLWRKACAALLCLALAASFPLPQGVAAAKAYTDIDVFNQDAAKLTATVSLGMSGETAGHQVTLLVVAKDGDPTNVEDILYIDQVPYTIPFNHEIKLKSGSDATATYTLYVGGSGMAAPQTKDFDFTTITSAPKRITDFTIEGQLGATTINEGAGTITLTMPEGTDLSGLAPAIDFQGISISPASGVATNFSNPPVDYVVTALDNSTKTYKVTVLLDDGSLAPVGTVFRSLDVSPAYASAAAGSEGQLTFAAATQLISVAEGADEAQGLRWFLNNEPQEDFNDIAAFSVTTEPQTAAAETDKPVIGANEVRVEAPGPRGTTLKAAAQFDLYAAAGASEAKDFSFNILSGSLTVFTAQTGSLANLPVSFAQGEGPLPKTGPETEVKLYTNYGKASQKEVPGYTAALASHSAVTVTAGEGAKNVKKVTVEIGGVAAAGSRTFNLSVSKKTPKITVTATPLDAAARGAYSRLVASASDGSPVEVEEVRLASNSAAGSIVHSTAPALAKDQVGINGDWTRGSVVAWAIVSSPAYDSLPAPRGVPDEALKPNQTAVKVTVKVANALNAPKAPKTTAAGNTVATKGRIDVTNLSAGIIAVPQAQHEVKDVNLLSTNGGAKVSDTVSEKFKIEVASDGKSFTIRGVEGRAVPGVTDKVWLQLVLADDSLLNIPKALSIKPVRSATRAYQSAKAVTLNTARANLGADVSLRFTSPIMAELGYVNLQAASMKKYNWDNVGAFDAGKIETYPLELLNKGGADDMQTYTLRFRGGKAPSALSNGRKLPNSVTVKLELWPVGTYQLKANGQPDLDATGRPKPLMRGTKAATAPTVVSVKVNIQQPLS
ncbi:MAG: hypothetical protein LBI54_08260 [Lachnospiraceae bacterium]|jgi:hypothetical protein|nr:hypothetical protein [Lachnospiraceae bacterium]